MPLLHAPRVSQLTPTASASLFSGVCREVVRSEQLVSSWTPAWVTVLVFPLLEQLPQTRNRVGRQESSNGQNTAVYA